MTSDEGAAPPPPAPPPSSAPVTHELKAAARPDGTGFRAIMTEDGRTVWACSHVHFTEHSARAHAERHLLALE
jgi:hypothetical protein